ncbi:hypothetical protein [Streptococcus intermedius]|uniref:hypothetical protein n=1 Tax=Streptococcus intermedius TaxID=1338 RepID=UPI0020009C59|nr:hypothetical protein [Streptococcus intermedius]
MTDEEILQKENEDLREECRLLTKMLEDERRFFVETLRHSAIKEYQQVVATNREHKKELQRATQAIN